MKKTDKNKAINARLRPEKMSGFALICQRAISDKPAAAMAIATHSTLKTARVDASPRKNAKTAAQLMELYWGSVPSDQADDMQKDSFVEQRQVGAGGDRARMRRLYVAGAGMVRHPDFLRRAWYL
jgi:hypothetical protein